jgi:hypothetical protein
MSRYGDGNKPIRILEYGWATGGTSPLTSVAPDCQAALIYALTQRLAQLRTSLKIKSIVQFQWQDAPVTNPPSTAWPDYAGIKFSNGSPKPARDAYRAAMKGEVAPAGATLDVCPPEHRAAT